MSGKTGRSDPLAGVDVAIAGLMDDAANRQRRRRMTTNERQKDDKRQAAREQDAARSRAYYDIPRSLKETLIQIAEEEGIPVSGIAGLLLADGVRRYHNGNVSVDREGVKVYTKSPKYEYKIEDGIIVAVLHGKMSLDA